MSAFVKDSSSQHSRDLTHTLTEKKNMYLFIFSVVTSVLNSLRALCYPLRQTNSDSPDTLEKFLQILVYTSRR